MNCSEDLQPADIQKTERITTVEKRQNFIASSFLLQKYKSTKLPWLRSVWKIWDNLAILITATLLHLEQERVKVSPSELITGTMLTTATPSTKLWKPWQAASSTSFLTSARQSTSRREALFRLSWLFIAIRDNKLSHHTFYCYLSWRPCTNIFFLNWPKWSLGLWENAYCDPVSISCILTC